MDQPARPVTDREPVRSDTMEHITPPGRGRSRRSGRARDGTRCRLVAAVILGVVAADVLVDAWIRSEVRAPVAVLGHVLRLYPSMNSGAAFGLLRDTGPLVLVLSTVTLALALGLLRGKYPPLMRLALALFVGGGLANLVERATRSAVLDYVDLGIGSIRWPTFNVADIAISGAVVLLALVALGGRLRRGAENPG